MNEQRLRALWDCKKKSHICAFEEAPKKKEKEGRAKEVLK